MTTPLPYTRWPVAEGYCGRSSYAPGDDVDLHCASRSPSFTVEVFRVGAERVSVWTSAGVHADDHDVPARAWEIGCDWPTTVSIPTRSDWDSGYYEIWLTDEHSEGSRSQSQAFFVLRPTDTPTSPNVLLMLSTNTYNAYNQWGGRCLYSGATAVSFQRPLERGYLYRPSAPDEVDFDGRIANVAEPSDPTHSRLLAYQAANDYPLWTDSSGWHNWERRFVRWAERNNLPIGYITNADLTDHPEVLDNCRLLLTVGHDEYWSSEMRDRVDHFVESGGNWMILGGNTCFWQVRIEDDGETMVCYKGAARFADPVRHDQPHRLTSMWSDPVIGRPETSTIGLTFTRGGYHRVGLALADGEGAYTVHRPTHWAFDGLDLAGGDQIGGKRFAVGYEVDGCALRFDDDGIPHPTHEDGAPDSLEILATAPARLISITDDHCEAPAGLWASLDPPGDLEGVAMVLYGDASAANVEKLAQGHAVMATFARGQGRVFHAGSADWAYGLDDDPVIQTITANVFAHLR